MSFAPASLVELGRYWTEQGGVNLGIVGDVAHTTGYHLGRDRIYSPSGQGDADYSVRLARDRAGLSNAAAAIDLGRLHGSLDELYRFSSWLVEQCMAGAPGTRDIREVIYSPDGARVQRYSGVDGLIHTGPGNGDASHIGHSHIGCYRDAEDRAKVLVFSPYFSDEVSTMDFRPIDDKPGVGTVAIGAKRGLLNLVTNALAIPAHDRPYEKKAYGRVELAAPYGGTSIDRQRGYLVDNDGQAHIALDSVVTSFLEDEPAKGPPAVGEGVVVDDVDHVIIDVGPERIAMVPADSVIDAPEPLSWDSAAQVWRPVA